MALSTTVLTHALLLLHRVSLATFISSGLYKESPQETFDLIVGI